METITQYVDKCDFMNIKIQKMTSLSNKKNNIVPSKEIIFLTILKYLCMCVLSGCVNVNVLVSVCLHPDLGLSLLCCGNRLCFKGTGCCLAPLKCIRLCHSWVHYTCKIAIMIKGMNATWEAGVSTDRSFAANIAHTNSACTESKLATLYLSLFPRLILITFHFIAT